MIKQSSPIVLAVFLTHGAFAQNSQSVETITVPSIGGLYCLDPDDIIKITAKQKPTGKCGVIPGGRKIFAVGVKSTNGVKGGVGIVEGIEANKAVAFLLVERSEASEPAKKKTPFDQRNFKVVSPVDVESTPDKWLGRDIEFRNVSVYWVSDADVRLITSTTLTVFASDIQGPKASFFRENCETVREAFSSKCSATVRFRYHWHGEDNPTSRSTRVVIKTNDIQILRRR